MCAVLFHQSWVLLDHNLNSRVAMESLCFWGFQTGLWQRQEGQESPCREPLLEQNCSSGPAS